LKRLGNVALFQIGWLASVLGAAQDRPFAGPVVVAIGLAVHLRFMGTKRECLLILASAILGTTAESVSTVTGILSYRADPPPGWLCPPWITALWANFAMTLRHSLWWLEPRPILATLVGAISGPLAYAAAARIGAIEPIEGVFAFPFLAILWGLALPFLLHCSKLSKIIT
jgi:hypothetical protein